MGLSRNYTIFDTADQRQLQHIRPPRISQRYLLREAIQGNIDELERIYVAETGEELDRRRLHYFVIYAVYFHLYTLVSSVVAATNGADFRVALGYAKYPRATAELVRHMDAWERGSHVL